MLYKVGDIVRVRSDLEVDKRYGADVFISNMKNMCGKMVTIERNFDGFYNIKEFGYNWTDEMFDNEEEEY